MLRNRKSFAASSNQVLGRWVNEKRIKVTKNTVAKGSILFFLLMIIWRNQQTTNVLSSELASHVVRDGTSASWKNYPLLSAKGVALDVPSTENIHTVRHSLNLTIVTDENIRRVPRADGDEAMQYILNNLGMRQLCEDRNAKHGADIPELIVVDVGGLFGDFGLSTAARHCPTLIFEPQRHHAQQIAQSVLLSSGPFGPIPAQHYVKVHNAAVSSARHMAFSSVASGGQANLVPVSEGSDEKAKMTTEQLDEVLSQYYKSHPQVLLLKVDVEGWEDDVWATATQLFADRRIQTAIFEYTPRQFEGRGTDYATFLDRLYTHANAQECYALHRLTPRLVKILRSDHGAFYETMRRTSMQTDIFCIFGNGTSDSAKNELQYDFLKKAPIWTPKHNLLK